jgi:phage terminase Nu1 subunit (DNA packaging protein)
MIGNLSELAALPGMPSEPTIKKLIDDNRDFPIITRGDRGVAWEIDLGAAATFIRELQRKAEEAARQRAQDVRQFGLDLLGADAASAQPDRPELTAKDQQQLIEAEIAAIKLGQLRGEFVRRPEVEAALGQLAVTFQQRISTLPERVAKRITLSREVQVNLQRIVDADLGWIADQLEKLNHAVSTDQADPAVRDGGGPVAPAGAADPPQATADGERMGDRA